MSIFICTANECPNKDVIYDFGEDNPSWAECGGCKTRLEAQSE